MHSHALPRPFISSSGPYQGRRSASAPPENPFRSQPHHQYDRRGDSFRHQPDHSSSAFRSYLHSNPLLASRCRKLKSQAGSLKYKLDDLLAVIEDLQPDQAAMDWAQSPGTIFYVPVEGPPPQYWLPGHQPYIIQPVPGAAEAACGGVRRPGEASTPPAAPAADAGLPHQGHPRAEVQGTRQAPAQASGEYRNRTQPDAEDEPRESFKTQVRPQPDGPQSQWQPRQY